MSRTFTDSPAVRESVPLLVGLMGASGSGKTYSALRIATGMQRVAGGEIFVIDTESKRSLHYADTFKFRHVPFDAPF
jgi:ABC-type sulfate/molybdate transport systems ATPase subunit